MTNGFYESTSFIRQVNASYQSCHAKNSTLCNATLGVEINQIHGLVTSLFTSIGIQTEQSQAYTGLLGQLACPSVNGL